MKYYLTYILTLTVSAACTLSAAAQTLEQQGFKPIDPLIDDVDPLSISLRQHSLELKNDGGGKQRYFRRTIPGDPLTGRQSKSKIYLIDRGVVAEFDRSDYALGDKGRVFSLIPPNTVFHLGIPKEETAPKTPHLPPPPEMINRRINREISSNPRTPRLLASNVNRPMNTQKPYYKRKTRPKNAILRQQRFYAVLSAIDDAAKTP